MIENIRAGITIELNTVVGTNDTAKAYGSGLLDVYSTPAMIAFMEKTCMELVQKELPAGHGTVGTYVEVQHLKASPVDAGISCRAELTEKEGNSLTFKVESYDEKGIIGKGLHKRFIIDEQKFLEKISKQR